MKKLIGYGFAIIFTGLLFLQSVRFDIKYSVEKGIDASLQIAEVNESVAITYLVLISSLLGVGAVDDPGFNIKLIIRLLTKYKKDK